MKKYFVFIIAFLFLLASCGTNKSNTSTPVRVSLAQSAPAALPAPDERLAAAHQENPDTVAWISIPGTTIDGAVQQSENNDYYLRRSEKGEESFEGCYFADYECNLASAYALSPNTILYGHTFDDDTEQRFFAQLWRLADNEEFAKNHRTIQLSLQDGMTEWEIISIGTVDTEKDTLAINAAPTTAELQQLVNGATKRSLFDFGSAPADIKQILTLSTCTGDYATRLVVVAVPTNTI